MMQNKEDLLRDDKKSLLISDIGFAVFVVGILSIMIVSAPPFILDFLLATSISSGLVIILVVVYISSPLDFSSFPSLLLLMTLFRLSLNIATTKNILLYGNQGEDAAGKVVEAFGKYVVGGDYLVGMVVFIILIVVNFQVITKGATRISEVAARFTLDAMPGKQISIDADLNAGIITEEEARSRRRRLENEANFYGAMDGALKFVRGDAIASIIITFVNITAGLAIGTINHNISLSDALHIYTILTIGDGLVSQIPALLTSTASGLLVTRTGSETNLARDLLRQIVFRYHPFAIASGFLFILSFFPGMPTVAFLGLASLIGYISYLIYSTASAYKDEEKLKKETQTEGAAESEKVERITPLDPMELEIGYELIQLVDKNQNGELLGRIRSLRRQLANSIGVVIPPIHIKDNLSLKSNQYQILIKGIDIAKNEVLLNHLLAMQIGKVKREIDGIKTVDPAFGIPAVWISEANRYRAKSLGYHVVDPATVITTHLKELIKSNITTIFSRDDLHLLIESFKESYPKLIEDLIPNLLGLGEIHKILKNLLSENISIRDLASIFEILAEYAPKTKNPDLLTEYVRAGVARQISNQFRDKEKSIKVMAFSPNLETLLSKAIKTENDTAYISISPEDADKMITKISSKLSLFEKEGIDPVVLTLAGLRLPLARLLKKFIPKLTTLSYNEMTDDTKIEYVSVIDI